MGEVITYKNEGAKGIFSQIKLDSGERVLISIAADEVKIFKQKFFGVIPGKTIWQFSDLYKLAKSLQDNRYDDQLLDILVNQVKEYNSIVDLQKGLDEFISKLKE